MHRRPFAPRVSHLEPRLSLSQVPTVAPPPAPPLAPGLVILVSPMDPLSGLVPADGLGGQTLGAQTTPETSPITPVPVLS